MLEDADLGTGGACTVHDGSVIQGVTDDQTSLAHEGRDDGGVGAIAHVEHKS